MAKKGYWIAHVNITNPERYKDYVAANAVAVRANTRRASWCATASTRWQAASSAIAATW